MGRPKKQVEQQVVEEQKVETIVDAPSVEVVETIVEEKEVVVEPSAAPLVFRILCNFKHDGVEYKQGSDIALDATTEADFRKKGFIQ